MSNPASPALVYLHRLLRATLQAVRLWFREKKFFSEVHGKYDARYFREELAPPRSTAVLTGMLAAFMDVSRAVGVKPILAHGALIGWWWARQLLPWDDDIDLLVSYDDLFVLRNLDGNEFEGGYLLEVNPNHVVHKSLNRDHRQNLEPNRIDARFIDTSSGLYIDITALRAVEGKWLMTKCPHTFAVESIYPLQSSKLAGVEVFIPADVEDVLRCEYGNDVLARTTFNGYRFDEIAGVWKMLPN